MNKLAEIVASLVVPQGEELDFPLEARAPSKAQAPVVVPTWSKREIGPDRIEAIPAEIAQAKPRVDYMQAALEASRASREGKRRAIGRKGVSETDKVEIAQALVGNLRRKDRL